MDKTSLGFQKPKEEEYYDINIFNQNAQLSNDLIEKNSSAIGQKLDKESSFYADLEAYYGNTKLIDDFQDISKWTVGAGTQMASTANAKIGNQSLKLIENDNVAGLVVTNLNNINLDLTILNNCEISTDNDFIYFVLYVSDVTKIDMSTGNGIRIFFDQASLSDRANAKYTILTSELSTGWNFVKIKKSEFLTNGNGKWTDIKSIHIRWTSVTNAQTAFVTFQLIQLIKKDPLEDKPNPFQKFGTKELNISIGEWFIGKEFDNVVCKELSGQNLASRSLEVLPKFKDFEGNISVIPNSTSYTIGGIWVDISNYILVMGTNTSLTIAKRLNGIDTSKVFNVNFTNTLVRLDIKRKGTDILIKVNDLVYETTFEYLGEFNLIVGCSNPENNYLENVSITEISNAHHSDISEVAKRLSVHPYSNPNLLINGDFQIWQRGTSFNISPLAAYTYTADRWAITGYNDNPLYQKTLIVNKVAYGLYIQKQANGQVNFQQQIEISNYLKNKNLILSFEISSTANESLQVRHIGGTEMNYTVSPTPKKIEFKFNSGNLDVLRLMIVSNTKFLATSPDSTITLKWVKLELGEIATPLSPRPVGEELALCKRYYQIVNATVLGSTGRVYRRLTATDFVQMRIHPTVQKVISPSTLALNCIHEFGNSDYILGSNSKFNFTLNGPEFCEIYAGHNGANMDNINYGCYIHVDAEIY